MVTIYGLFGSRGGCFLGGGGLLKRFRRSGATFVDRPLTMREEVRWSRFGKLQDAPATPHRSGYC